MIIATLEKTDLKVFPAPKKLYSEMSLLFCSLPSADDACFRLLDGALLSLRNLEVYGTLQLLSKIMRGGKRVAFLGSLRVLPWKMG